MSHQLMAWLQVLTRLVLVQIMMAALTVLGLGLLGAAPAAAAAARVAGPIRRDEALPVVGTMWRTWRATFWRANLAAAPAAVLVAAAAGNLLLLGAGGVRMPPPAGGLLASLAAMIGLVGLLVWLVSAVLSSEEENSPGQVLRAAVLLPLAVPGTALSLLITLAGVTLIVAVVPVLGVLCGASAAMLLTELLVSTRRQLLTHHLAGA